MKLVSVVFVLGVLGGLPAAHAQGAWTDAKTRLTWTAADNGYGVTAIQAANYCRKLTAGGFTDWSLPSIEELQSLFGGPANSSGHRILAPIRLTGWQWSSTPGQHPGQNWALDFGDGARASVVSGDSGLNRALCVRRPK